MARGRKPKIVEKIAEAVDKVIHPEHAEASQSEAEEMVKSGEAEIPAEAVVEKPRSEYQEHMAGWESKSEKARAKKSSQSDLDYQSHPKFHKFKGKAKGAE